MVTVQLRDVDDPDKVLFGPVTLPFELRENKPIYVRPFYEERRFGNKLRCFVITSVYRYQIFENEPDRSGIIYLARETAVDD